MLPSTRGPFVDTDIVSGVLVYYRGRKEGTFHRRDNLMNLVNRYKIYRQANKELNRKVIEACLTISSIALVRGQPPVTRPRGENDLLPGKDSVVTGNSPMVQG